MNLAQEQDIFLRDDCRTCLYWKAKLKLCSWWKCAGQWRFTSLLLLLLLLVLAVHPPPSFFRAPRTSFQARVRFLITLFSHLWHNWVLCCSEKKNIIERYSISLYSTRELQILTSFQSHRAESKSWEETATEKPGKRLPIQLFRSWGCICMLDRARWKWHFSLFLPSSNL